MKYEYNQIKYKISFVVPFNQYKWNVTGLKNATHKFQKHNE